MKWTLADLPAEQLPGGVERRRLTGERLELIVYTYPPGARFAVHDHEAEQLTIVLEGELVFTLGGEEVRLGPGDSLLIPGGRPHGAFVPAGAPTTRTYNLFTPVRDSLPTGG